MYGKLIDYPFLIVESLLMNEKINELTQLFTNFPKLRVN